MANLQQADYDDTHPVATGAGIMCQLVNKKRVGGANNGKSMASCWIWRGAVPGSGNPGQPTANITISYVDGVQETLIFDHNVDLYAPGLKSWVGG
jgi:hypothetical protein